MRKTPYCAFNFTLCYGELIFQVMTEDDRIELRKEIWYAIKWAIKINYYALIILACLKVLGAF